MWKEDRGWSDNKKIGNIRRVESSSVATRGIERDKQGLMKEK